VWMTVIGCAFSGVVEDGGLSALFLVLAIANLLSVVRLAENIAVRRSYVPIAQLK